MTESPQPADDQDTHTATVQKLFIQSQPALRGFILSMIPDFSLADDILQETFLVVTRKAHSFVLGTSFAAWVRTIARYKVLETLRSNHGRFESLSEEVIEALNLDQQEFHTNVDVHLQYLQKCLDELAPQARRAIDYRYRNDHRPPDIARLMGCTVQSINVTLSRARVFLRDCVGRKMAEPST